MMPMLAFFVRFDTLRACEVITGLYGISAGSTEVRPNCGGLGGCNSAAPALVSMDSGGSSSYFLRPNMIRK